MYRSLVRGLARSGLLLVSISATSAPLIAQGWPATKWTVSGGVAAIRVGSDAGWGHGPEILVRRDLGPHGGLNLRVSLPALGTDAGGAAVDLGPTLTLKGRHAELGASVGGTMFLVGDHSELITGGLGLYAAGHLTLWLGRNVGLTGGANVRSANGAAFPGVSVGIAIRL